MRIQAHTVLEFLNNLWGLGIEQEQNDHTGPPVLEILNNLWGLGIDRE